MDGDVSTDAIVVFERIDREPTEDAGSGLRIWFRGLVDESPWFRLEHVEIEEQLVLRVDFPQDEFYGMPVHLFVHRPAELRSGAAWILRAEDRKRIAARFVQNSDTILPSREVERIEKFYQSR